MPSADFKATFAALRKILKPYAKTMMVQEDSPTLYTLCSSTQTDRVGKPLFAASVHIGKAYVSYHLLGLYMNPALLKKVSPSLKKRMQGKACFNFKEVEIANLKELETITKVSIEGLRKVKLPWA